MTTNAAPELENAFDASPTEPLAPRFRPQRRDDPVRIRVAVRVRQLGFTLQGVSKAIGKGAGYLSVYLTRGHPLELPSAVRHELARVLDLPEGELIPRIGADPTDIRLPAVFDVPLFGETDEIDPAMAKAWAPRPGGFATLGGLFAVTVRHPSSRTRSGDTLYVSTTQTARNGDLTVCLQDGRITLIGELLSQVGGAVVVTIAPAAGYPVTLTGQTACKVVSIVPP